MAHSIWIPSLQQYRPFGNITTRMQLDLIKAIELDTTKTSHDFELQLVNTLQQLAGDSLVICDLSILDKLTIVLQLAVNSVGSTKSVSYKCPSCDHSTVNTLQLTAIIAALQKYLDKDYRKTIKYKANKQTFIVDLDIVPIRNHLKFNNLLIHNNSEVVQNVELLTWIRSISLVVGRKTQTIDISSLTLAQMDNLMAHLPRETALDIVEMARQHTTPIQISKYRCAHCMEERPMMYSLQQTSDLIVSALQLDAASIYAELFELKHHQLIGSIEDGMNLTATERTVFRKMHQQATSKSTQ